MSNLWYGPLITLSGSPDRDNPQITPELIGALRGVRN